LFFTISGFVIMLSAYGSKPFDFVVARIARLFPAFWTAVTLTAIFAVLLERGQRPISWPQYFANLTMVPGYLGFDNLDGVYWTLQTELKFYFLMFALIVTRLITRIRLWLTLWLLMVVSYRLFHQPFFLGWFITPFYSSYFIAGIAFYLIWTE